jgi:nicotinamidase-related amidase
VARFIVVVDTQRDFMAADGALSVAGAEGLIARGFRVEVPAGLTRGIARQIEEVSTQDFAKASLVIA